MKQLKAFAWFTVMVAGSLALLNVADNLSGGMVRKIGAR